MRDKIAYLAIGAIASIEKGPEAVVAVACGSAGGFGVRGVATRVLVRVPQRRVVAGDLDDVALLVWSAFGSGGQVGRAPVGGGGGIVTGRRVLSSDRDRGQSGE